MNDSNSQREDLLSLTADIVSSHVSNNMVAVSDVPPLIESVYHTLMRISSPTPLAEERPEPAVPVRRSVTPEHIICLEDGKKLKMLKRHLKTQYNMSPDEYRERWGLPADYPMVAPNYAEQRRKLAKKIGLGTARRRGRK